MAIERGQIKDIDVNPWAYPRRLKIVPSLVIGKGDLSCPGQSTATSRPWSSVIRVM